VVPVAVQREQQVALHDLAAAAGAHLHLRPPAAPLAGVHVPRVGAAHAPHVIIVIVVVDIVVGIDVVIVVVEDVLGWGVGAGVRVVQPRVHPGVHSVVRVVVHVRRGPTAAPVAEGAAASGAAAAGRHARRVLVRRRLLLLLLLLVVAAVVRRRRVRRTQLRVRVEVRVHHGGQGCQFVQHAVRLSPAITQRAQFESKEQLRTFLLVENTRLFYFKRNFW
jgi:hypothetical protein